MTDAATPADVLSETLSTMVAGKWLKRRLVNGSLHEVDVLAGLLALCTASGVEARIMEGVASNYPLADRELPTRPPEDYRYHTQYFLEVEGRLLSLWLDYKVFMGDFEDAASALAVVGTGIDVHESELRPEADIDPAPLDALDEVLPQGTTAQLVLKLQALAQSRALDRDTKPARKQASRHRRL